MPQNPPPPTHACSSTHTYTHSHAHTNIHKLTSLPSVLFLSLPPHSIPFSLFLLSLSLFPLILSLFLSSSFISLGISLYFYCCPSTLVSTFTPALLPASPMNIPTLAVSMCPLYVFPNGPSSIFPYYTSSPYSWLLSVCFLMQCLWLYFACLFC